MENTIERRTDIDVQLSCKHHHPDSVDDFDIRVCHTCLTMYFFGQRICGWILFASVLLNVLLIVAHIIRSSPQL